MLLSSLHAQRCFYGVSEGFLFVTVFSACAEMFLSRKLMPILPMRLLCMRRDVSQAIYRITEGKMSSLHAQRCFIRIVNTGSTVTVFSACAEMFLTFRPILRLRMGLLCMRRDVSTSCQYRGAAQPSSLHAQRCFLSDVQKEEIKTVFSACAEMFLSHLSYLMIRLSLLCMRRDVS